MPSPRPGALTAAAVLAIVYGSLFSLCGVCGLIGLAAQGAMGNNFMGGGDPLQQQMQKELQEALERDVPAYQVVQAVNAVLGLTLSLTLLIAGIGLLNMRSWARTLTLTACWIDIIFTLFQAIYQAALVMPAMSRAFQVALPAALPQGGGPEAEQVLRFMQTLMNVVTVATVILYLLVIVYLFIIVYLLGRPQVRTALAELRDDDFHDRPLQDDRRSRALEDDPDWEPPPDPDKDWRIK